jgi:hypothetical protein
LFPEVSAPRLIEMLERLPLMDGALTKRAMVEAQQGSGGGGTVSGVTVGPPTGASSPAPYSTGGSPTGVGRDDIEVVDSSGTTLTTHPALIGLVDFAQV